MGVEFLEFDLGFEAVLGFHHHVHQFIPVVVPFLDATKVAGPALIIDDERHYAVAQAFLEHNQSAHAAIAVLEGKDFLEADVEVQNVVALNLGLLFVDSDQLCQTGMDLTSRQQLAVPGPGVWRPVLAGTHLLLILIHRPGHQNMVELADQLLGQGGEKLEV